MRKLATITVLGKDRTGLVARITNFIFQQKANIEALEEQVTRGQFSMTVQASWKPEQLGMRGVEAGLKTLADELGMEIKLRFTETGRSQRMAIFVTKETHCLDAILKEWKAGRIKAEPVIVISNRPDLKSLAERAKIPFFEINYNDRPAAEKKILAKLDEVGADFIVLARFMKILSPNFVWRFKNKIINIHPSLLPSFPGAQAYRQAYERGVKIVGVTSHFVTMDLDEGPIISQGSFNLKPNEPLASLIQRGQELESKVLIEAIKVYLKNRLDVYWGKVHYL
jgi:formyltetrahydrofolate deformylase